MTPASGGDRTFTLSELSEHCGLPEAVVEKWVRAELLPALPSGQFGFRAVGTARPLTELHRAGWTAPRIKSRLRQARSVLDDHEEALRGLLASIGTKRVTVRAPDGRLLESTGQQLFDFEATAGEAAADVLQLRSPHDWFAIGVEAEAAGRIEDAARAYEHALPDRSAETHFNLGNCYYELRRRKDAVDQFTAAIARAPDYAEAWNNLGIVRGEVGDLLGAVGALERALALVPYYADAHYNLGEALSEVGEHERAREHYRAYLTFDPNSRWAEQARRRLQNPRG